MLFTSCNQCFSFGKLSSPLGGKRKIQCDSNYDLCEEKVPEVPAIRQKK
jgi:hypothetical protein